MYNHNPCIYTDRRMTGRHVYAMFHRPVNKVMTESSKCNLSDIFNNKIWMSQMPAADWFQRDIWLLVQAQNKDGRSAKFDFLFNVSEEQQQ